MFNEKVETKIEEYLQHTHGNEIDIMISSACGCLHCGTVFSARDVQFWQEDGGMLSGRCPHCGMPYVVGDSCGLPIDEKTMRSLKNRLHKLLKSADFYADFGRFCFDFYNGKIDADNPVMSGLYVSYLRYLHEQFNDSYACFALGHVYVEGLYGVTPDRDRALSYFEDPCLAHDGRAWFEAGLVYLGRGERGDNRKAFECFSKASALGQLEGSMYVAIFYLHGKYVKQDAPFALAALLSVFGLMYPHAVSEGTDIVEFVFCAFHIGYCFYKGIGVKAELMRAVRYWMIVDYFLKNDLSGDRFRLPWIDEFRTQYENLLRESGVSTSGTTMLLDDECFYDSFFEQQDSTTLKQLNYMNYAEDTGNLRFGFSASSPVLILDCASATAFLTKDCEWEMENSTFVRTSEEKTFHRFEFVGDNTIRFIFNDPVRGAVTIAEVNCEPIDDYSEDKE